MKIISNKYPNEYYDRNGDRIYEGDVIMECSEACLYVVYKTEDDELGIDATNPKWIASGRATPCEFGIYVFNEHMDILLIERGKRL